MSHQENSRPSLESFSRRNLRRNLIAGALLLAGAASTVPAQARPAAAGNEKVSSPSFGEMLNEFLLALWPEAFGAEPGPAAGEQESFGAVVERSEGDSEIEIEPRGPRVPPPPPPPGFGFGKEAVR